MIDMPEGWTPKPDTNIDPNLHATLNDVKDNEEMKDEYIGYIKEKLQEVYDPEISVDLYKLGLIYDVKITSERHVFVLMSLTSAFCPAADTIPVDVKQKVESIPGLHCHVRITMQPQWGREMIQQDIRDLLGL